MSKHTYLTQPDTAPPLQVQQSLEFTQNIVSDGLNGHGITQALLDSATEAVGNAWTVLREAGASPGKS